MQSKKMKILSAPVIFAIIFTLLSVTCFAAYHVTDTYVYLKWQTNGGASGFLGNPTTNTLTTPNKLGVYNHFQGGSIYRKNDLYEAFTVYGCIRAKWADLGWENSSLGFPITDELDTANKDGRFNHFEGGSIYWKNGATTAYEVQGAIRSIWSWLGWERSQLGFPTSDEYSVNGKEASHFENGAIYWKQFSKTNALAWPMMSVAKGSQSINGTTLNVTYYPNQLGAHVVITGKGFTPKKSVSVYLSRKSSPYCITTLTTDSNGTFTYDSRPYGSTGYIRNSNIQKVNGVLTVYAQDDGGPAAINSKSCYQIGNNVTLD